MYMFLIFLNLIYGFNSKVCTKVDCILTQSIENEGFHRILHWIVEVENSEIDLSQCFFSLHQEIPTGAYINPDEIADLNRIGEISAHVDGVVDIEKPMQHSEVHSIYIFKNITYNRVDIDMPVHIRYQRAQISGDFGKVEFLHPSLLFRCKYKVNICGHKVRAPISNIRTSTTFWTNVTYKSNSERVEILIPIGNLDDYPLVSIVTFLVTCSGCIYLMSVILSKPLPGKM